MSADASLPGIQITASPVPGPDEAAAIAAAIERFGSETAPVALPAVSAIADPWRRYALLAGVGLAPAQRLREPWLNI